MSMKYVGSDVFPVSLFAASCFTLENIVLVPLFGCLPIKYTFSARILTFGNIVSKTAPTDL